MTTVLLVATIVCIVANAAIAAADYVKADFVLKNSAEVGVPARALPYLATLKLAGAIGLVAGLAGLRWLGVAAGVGLLLFFVGAVVAHVRARVFHNLAFPASTCCSPGRRPPTWCSWRQGELVVERPDEAAPVGFGPRAPADPGHAHRLADDVHRVSAARLARLDADLVRGPGGQ